MRIGLARVSPIEAMAERTASSNGPSTRRLTPRCSMARPITTSSIATIPSTRLASGKEKEPRPERPFFVDQLAQEIPFYAVRHCVKPGVTGWAQVRYQYGASVDDAVQKLQYDLYYVKNHTIVLDTLVLFETVRVVLTGEGAH